MVKVKAVQKNGRVLIGFGLSDANLEELKKGNPIFFGLDQFAILGHDVMIFHGETEQKIEAELRERLGLTGQGAQ